MMRVDQAQMIAKVMMRVDQAQMIVKVMRVDHPQIIDEVYLIEDNSK